MWKTMKLFNKTQADSTQTIDLTGLETARIHQIQIDVSSTPAAGTMDVSIRTPGADDYVSIGTIDLVNGPLVVDFSGYADAVRLTPTSLDTGKSYSAYVFCVQND